MKLLFFWDWFYPSFGADLLVAFLGAVFGLGAAYWIYLLSIHQVRNDRLKYVVSLIETIVPSAIRQAGYCNEHAQFIVEQPWSNRNLRLEANRDPKRLADKVDQEGVYHAFLWKYGRTKETYNAFQNLYGYIDYLDYLIDDLIKTNERVLTFTWERKKQYQLTFKKAKEAIQSLTLIKEIEEVQPELISYSSELLEKFSQKQSGENILDSYQIVVQPLQEYIIRTAKQHPKVTELVFLTQTLTEEYTGIELSAKHNAEDYKEFAVSIQRAAENLINESTRLRGDYNSL